MERTIFRNFQKQGVVKTPGALQHGAAAGTTAVNRNCFALSSCHVELGGNFVCIANNDKMFARFPKAEDFFAIAGFAPVEQRLIAREVFDGRGESQVEQFHFAVALISLALTAKLGFIVCARFA